MNQQEIDQKLSDLEEIESGTYEEPEVDESEEVEVEPELEEDEIEEDSSPSEDDTDLEEPSESEGDDEEDLTHEEKGLIGAVKAEREKRKEVESELRDLRESIESLKETVVSSVPAKDIQEAYKRDPKGVIANINQNIEQMLNEDPIGNAAQVEKLRDMKLDLREQALQERETQAIQTTKQSEIATLLFKEVPDYGPEKNQILTNFALNELGYTREELVEETDIQARGEKAVREIARINRLFEKTKTPKKVEKKKVKKATQSEKPGAGHKKPAPNLNKVLEKARKTGDWDEYFEAKGL